MNCRNMVLTAALSAGLTAGLAPALHAQASTFSDQDNTFLKKTAEGNLAEVKMAELVLKTSKNPEIVAFAKKMITDHTALYNGEKSVAAKAGVTLPTSPSAAQDAIYLKLKVLSGETFDKSYVKSMVADHHDDTTEAKKEFDTTKSPDMKALSAHAGGVMEQHTKMIDTLAGKMGLQ